MMIIVRLNPKTDLESVWNFVEHKIGKESTPSVKPLYATQAEGMMNVGVIFDVKDPNDISHFLIDTLSKCDECHHTKTISLMKPTFFPIPVNKPENIQRYVIRIYTHPRNYKSIYNYLINYDYTNRLFPIYISYSLGDEDLLMNVGADSEETVNRFVREKIRTLEGADTAMYYHVVKAKRFAPLEELIKKQKEHFTEKAKQTPESEMDQDFDWVEDFEQFAMLTGAFRRDIQ